MTQEEEMRFMGKIGRGEIAFGDEEEEGSVEEGRRFGQRTKEGQRNNLEERKGRHRNGGRKMKYACLCIKMVL